MDSQDTMPGFSEMMEKIMEVQKNNVETIKKSMIVMTGKTPLNWVSPEMKKDHSFSDVGSQFLEMMNNVSRGMFDMFELFIPVTDGEGDKNPMDFMTRNMTELPARMMKKLLEIPPVGITRPYQEKINHSLDKITSFHSAAMDFLYCTFLPVEEATMITLREMAKQSETMNSPEDMKNVYDKWIKTLEHEYQSLFKTERYKKVIARIFSELGEFRSSYRELTVDLVHLSGLPGGKEVDGLCKDMFAMKKNMKEFERQLKQISESSCKV